MTRVVFMGTPEFAVPSLKALYEAGYDIVGVITQPDRPVGRGHKLAFCPVKIAALELGLPVYQFERLRKPEGVEALEALAPDIVITAAFGQILSQRLLDIPRLGTINVHASLLPKYRGAAPINRCIMMGETVTGVTTMLTDAGIDTGDMLLSRETVIGDMETAGELTERLSVMGAELLIETLDEYLKGDITPIKQNHAEATHQPMLNKSDRVIDWNKSAIDIANQVRGLSPKPCAYTGNIKVYMARPLAIDNAALPGTVLRSSSKEGLAIACGDGAVEILEMQAPNAKRMSAKAYLMGKMIETGTLIYEV